MRCSILIKTEMVEKTKPQDLAEVDQGEKTTRFCLSCYSLETLSLLVFKETSIRQKFKLALLQQNVLAAQGSEKIPGI